MASQPAAVDRAAESRGSNVAASAGFGVLAAGIGYLLTYAIARGEVRDVVGSDIAEWKGVAWYFYNAHMVDVETSRSVGSFGGTDTLNFIAESSSSSADALYVLPPLVLFAAGAALAVYWSVPNLGNAVAVGAPVMIGYAVVMGLGAVVTEASAEWSFFGIQATGSIAVPLLPALVLGGILYPLVFATAGAVVATVVDSQ
ncbi:hypothetical protein [Natrinema gelatinilyticum]|uniref:hypothetical protein n=1 Tax=Natrinema gelatinilyticum TaxID=2961571 RepID=UPI0020C1E865|nr:hypothetical protein [Natrinema gelatinilyticum]